MVFEITAEMYFQTVRFVINVLWYISISKVFVWWSIDVIGLVKSQKLPANILTPTTKAADHDVPVTPAEVGLFQYSFVTLNGRGKEKRDTC